MFILFAAYVRRLHDVGRHARHELARGLLVATLLLAPLAVLVFAPDLPQWMHLCILGIAALPFLAGIFTGWRGSPTWQTGDPGTNAFGPPPPS
ncbi:hypothetical protein [Brevundimonas sp.]|uniref:hypothetical protein n=1 Tax=Brevundimonas sp. TaxID=1871086 RepID=UPI003A5BC959